MKPSLRVVVACLVAGLVWATGCQQATSTTPPPDISTASAATMDKYISVMDGIPSQSEMAAGSIPGITVSGSPTGSTFDVTVTFNNYASNGSLLNGSLRMKGSMGGSGGTIHEWGTLTLSGAKSGTVALDITITMTTSPTLHLTETGTVTIDGTTYAVNVSM